MSTNFALPQEFDTQYLGPEHVLRCHCSGTNVTQSGGVLARTSIYKLFPSVLRNALATFDLNGILLFR